MVMRARWLVAVIAALALLVAACSDSDDEGGGAGSSTTSTTDAGPPSSPEPQRQLQILVTNDDGVAAEGIDVVVEALRSIENVKVTVVAPADQRSGTGGQTTEGELEVTDTELASGYPAKAVDGFPADTVRVAIDEMGLEPDVVVSGINEGQNLGPLVDVSGTVGAARGRGRSGRPRPRGELGPRGRRRLRGRGAVRARVGGQPPHRVRGGHRAGRGGEHERAVVRQPAR